MCTDNPSTILLAHGLLVSQGVIKVLLFAADVCVQLRLLELPHHAVLPVVLLVGEQGVSLIDLNVVLIDSAALVHVNVVSLLVLPLEEHQVEAHRLVIFH